MMPRAASGLLVSALIRRVGQAGGFGAVLARGDDMAGGVLLVCTERGTPRCLLERWHDADGNQMWRETGHMVIDGKLSLPDYQFQRRRTDPDLWIVELDTAHAERFAAEMIATG